MNRAVVSLAFAFSLLACALAAGCAAPGEPTARHPIVPVAIADLAVRQYGAAFALTFTLPARSMDREPLAEHPTIEIYRALLPPGGAPDKQTAWRLAYTIPSEQVDPYLNTGRIEFRDLLTPDDFSRPAGSLAAYKVQTRAGKTRSSTDSNIVTARIYPAPEAPHDVHVKATESALVLTWEETAPSPGATTRSYHVYRGALDSDRLQDASQAKLESPLELAGTSSSPEFQDSHFEFGTTYRYTVRSVAQFGMDLVESADSAPAVFTPRDVFPPASPTNLEITIIPATGQAPAYIELAWAISPETDLAGYSVYRSDSTDSPGERVSMEILPSPTFRDMSVVPGKRYFYRVSALDRAGNESPKSSAVQADVP